MLRSNSIFFFFKKGATLWHTLKTKTINVKKNQNNVQMSIRITNPWKKEPVVNNFMVIEVFWKTFMFFLLILKH